MIRAISIKRTTDASTEPVTLAEAKEHLRVDFSDDDSYISTLITAARQSIEISTKRAVASGQTYEAGYAIFPLRYDSLEIPNPPLVSVTSIKYFDDQGVEHTVNTNKYNGDTTGSNCANVFFKDTFSLPTVSRDLLAPVKITYTAGYTDLPKPLHQAILLLVSHYYDTREPISIGSMPFKISRSVDFLCNQYRIRGAC